MCGCDGRVENRPRSGTEPVCFESGLRRTIAGCVLGDVTQILQNDRALSVCLLPSRLPTPTPSLYRFRPSLCLSKLISAVDALADCRLPRFILTDWLKDGALSHDWMCWRHEEARSPETSECSRANAVLMRAGLQVKARGTRRVQRRSAPAVFITD